MAGNEGPTEFVSDHIKDHSVVRDHAFFEIYADVALSVRSPRNLQLAFVRIESRLSGCTVEEGEELPDTFSMEPSVRELGRATLPIATAATLAIDILDEVASTGILNFEDVEGKLSDIISRMRASFERRRGRQDA